MRHIVIALLVAASSLAGCASLQNAGTAEYSVRPLVLDSGASVCCEVSVKNGKEIALVKARVTRQGDNYTVDLEEHGVQAFAGQAIVAGATRSAIDGAAQAAVAASLAPIAPAILPAVGAALAAPGLGAAAVGAGAAIAVDRMAK